MATAERAVKKTHATYAMTAHELTDVANMIWRIQSVADDSDSLYLSSGSIVIRNTEGFILGTINIGDDGDEVVFTADLV